MASVTDMFNQGMRIAVPCIVYSDSVGHVLRTTTWGSDGGTTRPIVIDQRYDALGRPREMDQPRFDGNAAYLGRRLEYDTVNRVVGVTTLDGGTSQVANEHTATTTYDGLVTTLTNLKHQQHVETPVADALIRTPAGSWSKPTDSQA
jgi:hypothetical protein